MLMQIRINYDSSCEIVHVSDSTYRKKVLKHDGRLFEFIIMFEQK